MLWSRPSDGRLRQPLDHNGGVTTPGQFERKLNTLTAWVALIRARNRIEMIRNHPCRALSFGKEWTLQTRQFHGRQCKALIGQRRFHKRRPRGRWIHLQSSRRKWKLSCEIRFFIVS